MQTCSIRSSKKSTLIGILSAALCLMATEATLAQSPFTPPGTGTELDPYLISELGHLVWMSDTVADSAGKYYQMTADIDASDTANWNDEGTPTDLLEGFMPIGTNTLAFSGIFDGNGYTISDLTINRPTTDSIALFGYVGSGAQVQNLGMVGGAITGHFVVGGLCGFSSGTVSNCYNTGAVTANNDFIGGLAGASNGTITDCYVTGAVSGNADVGGLVGNVFSGTISNCHSSSMVTGIAGGIGGLVGTCAGPVSNCYATGDITGDGGVGGLIGSSGSSATVTDCHATGAVTGNISVGGLIGYKTGQVSNCYATGAVTGGSKNVGGLIGNSGIKPVSNCYAIGEVNGAANYVGGLIGSCMNEVSACYAINTVTGIEYVGGLIGKNSANVSECYAAGTVQAEAYVGGLVGENTGTITNCLATSSASGSSGGVGGLVGNNTDGTVSHCFATGIVSGFSWVGGLIGGGSPATTSDSYWDMETSGFSTSIGGTGTTTAEMKQQATFAGWNFASIWSINEGDSYPWLQIFPPPFKLTVDTLGPGSVTINPTSLDGTYAPGTEVTLTAVPNGPDDLLVRWAGALPNNELEVTVVMDSNKSVTAIFQNSIAIYTLADLTKIGNDPAYPLDGAYVLMADIDASETANWNDAGTSTDVLEGFKPIGATSAAFTGVFDGNGHTITGLFINRPKTSAIGLFGFVASFAQVRNLGLIDGEITGYFHVGALIGFTYSGTVSNCYATGTVIDGFEWVGGLIGDIGSGTISNCYTSVEVSGLSWIGGLAGVFSCGTMSDCYTTGNVHASNFDVGGLVGSGSSFTISNCYAMGNVSGGSQVGGLVGLCAGTLTNCYASANVTGSKDNIGGLVGQNRGDSRRMSTATMTSCYATGMVAGGDNVGGLVGQNGENDGDYNSLISQCYATGAVNGMNYIGGLAGFNYGEISNCYANGTVDGVSYVGGLMGDGLGVSNCYSTGAVTGEEYVGGLCFACYSPSSYWDLETSGISDPYSESDKTTAEMMQQATFVDWDFADIWGIVENQTYPYLQSLYDPADPPVAVSAVSLKTHGSAGEFGINVLDRTDNNDIECRRYGVTKLVVGFDRYVQGVDGLDASDVSLSSGTVDAVTLTTGNTLTIEMSGTTNGVPLTITFPGIANVIDDTVICEDSLCIRQLVGDIYPDGVITALDRVKVRDAMIQAVDASNFRNDVYADGTFTALDRVVTRDAMSTGFIGSCP